MVFRLPRIRTTNSELNRIQENVATGLNFIQLSPLTGSISRIENIVLETGIPQDVAHKLGRQPQGWIITDANGPASVFRSGPMNTLTVTLEASANVTISVLFF